MSRKTEPARPPLARLLASTCVFREWAAVELAARLPETGSKCGPPEAVAARAVALADALAAELERTAAGRPGQEGEG